MARARACACACAALLAWPALAAADVLSVSGDVTAAVPPNPDLGAGANASETAWAFVELDGIGFDVTDSIAGEIPVGRWGAGAMPPADAPIAFAPGDLFTSHLIYVDNPTDGAARFQGSVVFDAEIVAIFVSDERLNATDPASPFGYSLDRGRGTEVYVNDTAGDVVERANDGLTVKLDVGVNGEDRVDTIRVITRAEPPVAEVSLDCPISVMVEGTTVTSSGAIHNAIPGAIVEPSRPVDVVADWVPDVTVLSTGSLTLDGAPLACTGMEGAATRCPLGRVAPGDHRLDATSYLPPGTATTLRVALVGHDVTSAVCEIPLRIPNPGVDAGPRPGADGGTPPPPGSPTIPRFGGGGGARCSAAPTGGGLGALALLSALALLRWRRR